jgi:hypothetical protein
VVPVLLVLVHGSPFSSNGRDWVAFKQHFALGRVTGTQDAWFGTDAVVKEYFPHANSVMSALWENPIEFASHCFANLLAAPAAVFSGVIGIGRPSTLEQLTLILMVGSVAVGFLLSLIIDHRRGTKKFSSLLGSLRSRSLWGSWVLLIVLLIVLVVSVSVVYPRFHYLVIPGLGLVILASAIQGHVGNWQVTRVLPVALVMSLFIVFIALTMRGAITRVAYPAPLAATLARMAESGNEWRFLGGGQLLPTYLPKLKEITDTQPAPGESFSDFIDRNQINSMLKQAPSDAIPWTKAPGFTDFMDDPSAFGFGLAFPGSELLVKDGSLK